MPVEFVEWYTRDLLRSRPDALFVFGDNEQRRGKLGQAAACRGEPNGLSVATKAYPSRRHDSYWSDEDFERCAAIIDADLAPAFKAVRSGRTVVFPRDGIGTGLSELPTRAPRLMEHIRMKVRQLVATAKAQSRA